MRWWQGRARPPRRGVLGRRRPVGLGSSGGRALRPAALAGSFRNERGRHSGSAWQRPGFQGTVAFWGTCSHHEAVCDVLGGSSVHTAESGPRRDVTGALGGTPEAWGSAAAGDTEAARGSPCGGPRRHGGVSTRCRPVGPRAPQRLREPPVSSPVTSTQIPRHSTRTRTRRPRPTRSRGVRRRVRPAHRSCAFRERHLGFYKNRSFMSTFSDIHRYYF